MNNQLEIQTISLISLTAHIKENLALFNKVVFTHVYQELNLIADTLSKDLQHLLDSYF